MLDLGKGPRSPGGSDERRGSTYGRATNDGDGLLYGPPTRGGDPRRSVLVPSSLGLPRPIFLLLFFVFFVPFLASAPGKQISAQSCGDIPTSPSLVVSWAGMPARVHTR